MNRLWRSRSVAFIVLLLAFALVAAACSSDDGGSEETTTTEAMETTTTEAMETTTTEAVEETTTTTEPSLEKPYGGEAINGADQYPATFNGFINDNTVVSDLGNLWACGTQDISGFTLELIPEVVTELPTVANGGIVVNEDGTMTIKYTIRDEAVWADGTPISGDDYQFTYEQIMATELTIKTNYEDIVDTVVGDKTFEFTMSAPTLQAELMFGELLPKHAVEGTDLTADWNETRWVTCGPFQFDSASTGEFVTAVRNDNYWKTDPETGQQLPYLDAVEFRFIPEAEEIIRAFKRRDVQVIQPPPVAGTIDELVSLESSGAVVDLVAGPVWEHLNFQFGPGRLAMNAASVNSNLDYRRAVAHLVDRDAIAAAVSQYTQPLSSYIDVFTPGLSQHAWDRYPYDPGKAEQLLLKVKAAEEIETVATVFSTTSNGDTRVIVSEALRPMFEAVGIDYQTQLQDSQIFFGETLDTGTWDVGLWAWVGSPGFSGLLPIHDAFDPDAPPPDGSNYYRWGTEDSSVVDAHTERFAEVRDLMNSTVDDRELASLVIEAEDILASRMVMLPLYSRPRVGAVWGDEVAGFVMNPTQASPMWNIETWYRVDLSS